MSHKQAKLLRRRHWMTRFKYKLKPWMVDLEGDRPTRRRQKSLTLKIIGKMANVRS